MLYSITWLIFLHINFVFLDLIIVLFLKFCALITNLATNSIPCESPASILRHLGILSILSSWQNIYLESYVLPQSRLLPLWSCCVLHLETALPLAPFWGISFILLLYWLPCFPLSIFYTFLVYSLILADHIFWNLLNKLRGRYDFWVILCLRLTFTHIHSLLGYRIPDWKSLYLRIVKAVLLAFWLLVLMVRS